MSLKILQKAKESGGLELSNCFYYYIADRVTYVLKWIKPNPLDFSWLDTEQTYYNQHKHQMPQLYEKP